MQILSTKLEELFGLHLESCGDMNWTRPGTYPHILGVYIHEAVLE